MMSDPITPNATYEAVDSTAPIRQGDIFESIPRAEISLSSLAVIDDDDTKRLTSWKDLIEDDPGSVAAVLGVQSVRAIVITQDCDAVRGQYITLAQIDEFVPILGITAPPVGKHKKWANFITRQTRANLRLFYLPPDPTFGFEQRMAADFRVLFQLPRQDLEAARDLRVARLGDVATDHFRETFAQYFRRYAFNHWYPLTKEEFEAYSEDNPQDKPFPHQE